MKRILAAILFLSILLLNVTIVPACAEQGGRSVDMVIILDQSRSMDGANTDQNDPDGYRFDAAQMLVAMVDMNGSRVAVVPFNHTVVYDVADRDFVDISSWIDRDAKNTSLTQMRQRNTSGGTDYGEALAYAYNLIVSRTDKSNSPMIVLLTDGANSPQAERGVVEPKNEYTWNAALGRFTEGGRKTLRAEDFDNLAKQAVQKAKEQNIPIYTVALYNPKSANDADNIHFRNMLEHFASETGALNLEVSSNNANELPAFFAQVLADKIGSSLQRKLVPTRVGDSDVYQVRVPILNMSVMEANLFVSTEKDVDKNSLTLLNPQGKPFTSDEAVSIASKNFTLFKILPPKQNATGDWTLQFKLQKNGSLNNVSFNLLYNYDLTLAATAGLSPTNMQTSLVSGARKTDTLYTSVYFVSNETGKPSTDDKLYAVRENAEEWETINVRYTLRDANGNPVLDINGKPIVGVIPSDLAQSGQLRFYCPIELNQLRIGANGTNALKSGDYRLDLVVSGAGLHQEGSVSFSVVNQPPRAQHGIELNYTVEDEKQPATMNVQTFTESLNAVKDPDNDQLTFESLQLKEGAQACVDWTLNNQTGEMTVSTIKDNNGRLLHGTTELILTVSDSEGEKVSVPVTVNVRSVLAEAESGEFTLAPDAVNAAKNDHVTLEAKSVLSGTASKNAQVEVRVASILDENGAKVFSDEELSAINAGNETVSATFTRLTIPTKNASANWTVNVEFYLGSKKLATRECSITVPNVAPTFDAALLEKFPSTIGYNGSWVSFLEPDTTEEERTLDCTALFADADNEAGLIYTVELQNASGAAPVTVSDPAADPEHLVVTPVNAGNITIVISAEDGDGEKTTASKEIVVQNLTLKWSVLLAIAVAAVVALALLIRFIYWLNLPRFRSELTVTEGQSVTPTSESPIRNTKKPERVRNYLGDLIGEYGLKGVEHVMIKPRRRRDGSVGLWLDKKAPSLKATLETEELVPGKKHMKTWNVGQSLYLQAAGSDAYVRVTLKNNDVATFYEPDDNSGGWVDSVTNVGLGFGESVPAEKVARNNTAANTSFFGGEDDFSGGFTSGDSFVSGDNFASDDSFDSGAGFSGGDGFPTGGDADDAFLS